MRHASILGLAAVSLGPLLVLTGCDRSANAPASPRTSEIVHLTQAPIDAVPWNPNARPAQPPAGQPPVEDETETDLSEAEVPAPTDTAPATPKTTTPTPAPATPPPVEASKPEPSPDVRPQT